MLRRSFAVLVLTICLTFGLGGRARAAEQDFTLHNNTGVEIHAVYISPSASDKWEENLIQGETLADGSTLDIKFDEEEDAAEWDIRVDDGSGNYLYWRGINLKQATDVELDANGTAHVKNGG